MLDDLFSATLGFLVLSKEKAEAFIDILVDKGEMQRDEAKKVVNRLIEKGREETERYREQVKRKIDGAFQEKFATREDLQRLEAKLDEVIALVRVKLQ